MSDFGFYFVCFLPEIGLALLALVGVIVSAAFQRLGKDLPGMFLLSQGIWSVMSLAAVSLFRPMLGLVAHTNAWVSTDASSDLTCVGLLAISLIINAIYMYARDEGPRRMEFMALVAAGTIPLMVLARSMNLGLTFVALEVASLIGVVIISLGGPGRATGGLRYLLPAGISAGMMLWGVALIAAATGTLDYAQLPQAVATALEGPNWVSVGMALVLASVAFKLGIFPFGYYLPAVYERCGYAGLGFLATLGKAGAVIALIGLVQGPFIGFWRQIVPIFGVLAILTLIWGVFGALRQTDIKRLLALSGVVHAGFILGAVSLGISNPAFMQTAWFYLVAYVLALGLIAMVLGLSASGSNAIDALRNTYARNPYLGIAGVVGFASLAGLPPLVGFMAKFFVFLRAVQSGSWGLVWVMIFASVVGLYYYFKVVLTLIGRAELIETEMPIAGVRITIPRTAAVVVGALMLAIVLLGVCPGLVPTGI